MSYCICPHCFSKIGYSDRSVVSVSFDVDGVCYDFNEIPPDAYQVTLLTCPVCKKEGVIFRDRNGNSRFIHPLAVTHPCPDYVPKFIADDFREAQLVCDLSPKSAATLCRRCLEGMIRDFYGIDKGSLNDSIKAMSNVVEPQVLVELDTVRNFGNIGAHMEKNSNLIIEIEPEEATVMVELIWTLINEWYVSRHNRQQLHQRVIDLSADLKQRRDGSRA